MQPIDPNIPKQLHSAISSIAAFRHVSQAEIIREAIEEYLAKHKNDLNLSYNDDNNALRNIFSSTDSFEKIWDNEEDEIYDKLYGEQS